MNFYLIIGSLTLNVIVILLLAAMYLKQRRLSRNISMIGQEAAKGDLPAMINKSYQQINNLTDEIEQLNQYYSKLYRLNDNTLQNIGLIRYDAFEDMGGNLSFSMAMLNNQNDGLILTSINGRNDHRLYVKEIVAGVCPSAPLGEEEKKALQEAQKSARQVTKKLAITPKS